MTEMKKANPNLDKKIRITDTTLRDAHQSLWATRLRIEDIIGIIEEIDSAGYYSLEVWGGATFDVCLRFLRENPWERLRIIKSHAKKTPLQMLLRGQNLVGYRNYSDDLVDRFVALACENGMNIFRVFDALNDTRNIESAVKAVKKYGGHAQGTISYTISPVHTVEKFVEYAKEQINIGIDSLCIKDMAGILTPSMIEKLTKAFAVDLGIPLQIHSHATGGMAVATYMAAVKAGAGAVDCAISSLAGFSSQPPIETMVSIFNDMGFETGIDLKILETIEKHFTDIAPKRRQSHIIQPIIDPGILIHQIPGGMISNFRSQLDKQNALDRLPEVLDEVTAVRKDLGYPPLVTPTSQIVGSQAVMNVLAGERYKMVSNEVKAYLKGMYGKSPEPVNEDFIKKIIGNEDVVTCRPADLLAPMLPEATKTLESKYIQNEEDIISYCILPEPALEYFKWRNLPPALRPETPAQFEERQTAPKSGEVVKLDQEIHPDDVKGISKLIDRAGRFKANELIIRKGALNVSLRFTGSESQGGLSFSAAPSGTDNADKADDKPSNKSGEKSQDRCAAPTYKTAIKSPICGTFYSYPGAGKDPFVKAGDVVNSGDKVCVVEAMKMFNEIYADKKYKILKFLVENGQNVVKGQPLIAVEDV